MADDDKEPLAVTKGDLRNELAAVKKDRDEFLQKLQICSGVILAYEKLLAYEPPAPSEPKIEETQ